MRKYQQRQILELLKTIGEAQSAGLHADCQESACSIGEFIESVKGEGTQTVALLEEYCELLYKVNTGEIKEKVLRKHLIKIENSVASELKPTRIEIAFLSYKASMSDSLESIYLAAKSDPDCDAYWIPVPYYNYNPNGSSGDMHCEGPDCYSNKIECTDWRKYDIEARRPDVIFTFNPYDAGNYVTSVHPDFYCERLRNLTDLLIYIPYFIVATDVPKHFCTVAGCMFAHKVVLQSEKVRDTYIRVFKEAYGNRFGKPKDKFIALGSPKYDKVFHSTREDFKLPEAWDKLIDGKKVILYNTTIHALLKGNSQYLEKICSVLDTFRNRDDVVLWWRPHPLNESSVQSMRPQLLAEYNQIVSDYKRDGYGIYDDTPDLHRAIIWSDAYYGNGSSLVPLYQTTGKPVMIAHPKLLRNKINLTPSWVYVSDDYIWFVVKDINALFKVSMADWVLELVGSIPGEKYYIPQSRKPLYSRPVENNGVLYFPPSLAREIAAYSLCDNIFEKISYACPDCVPETDRAFSEAVKYKNFVFFMPFYYPAIVRLNVLTKEIDYFTDWVEPLKRLTGDVREAFFSYPHTVGNVIWLAAMGANAVIKFDMEVCVSTVYEVGDKDYSYDGICFDGENYWLSPRRNTPIIKWNPQGGIIKKFPEPYDDMNRLSRFLSIQYCAGYVWLLPRLVKHTLIINTQTDAVSIVDKFEITPQEEDKGKSVVRCSAGYLFDDTIYTYDVQKKVFILYICASKERKEKAVSCPPEIATRLEALLIPPFPDDAGTMGILKENNTFTLDGFIQYVIGENAVKAVMKDHRMEIMPSVSVDTTGTAGQAIYAFAKDLVSK